MLTGHPSRSLRDGARILRTDPVFWIAMGFVVVSLVPYFVPLLDEWAFYDWRWTYADVPVSFGTLLAVSWGCRRVVGEAERRFWFLIVGALAAASVVEVANAFIPLQYFTPTVEITLYTGYLVYYLALLLAAAVAAGKLATDGGWRLEQLRTVGFGVLAMTFILYFEAVPYVTRPSAYEWWYPGMFMYAALDAVVALMLVRAAQAQHDPRWTGILLGLAAVSGLHAITDSAEAVLVMERFVEYDLPPFWDLAWYVPEVVLIAVARRYLADPQPADGPEIVPETRDDRGAIVLALLIPPAAHVLLYATGANDAELRGLRDVVIGVFLVVMGALILRYFRLLEAERTRGRQALALSEERYRTFVRLGSDVAYRAEATPPIPIEAPPSDQVDAILSRVRVESAESSPTAEVSVSSALGCPITDLLPESDRRAFLLRWVASDYKDELESLESTPTGDPRSYRYVLTGIVGEGLLRRVWLTRSDITEIKRATAENERLVEELERARKLESLGTLAGGIAHDFNNLLAPILGYADLARESIGRDDEDARVSLAHVLSAAHRASDLVDQVLAVSRRQPRRTVPLLVQQTAREVAVLLRPGLPGRVHLDLSIDDTCPPVLGDPSRVHQVLMNLCTNAAQAIGDAPGRIGVRVSHDRGHEVDRQPRGWVRVDVDDNGPGLDPEVARRAFDPFFTTKPVGEGTGLGLSVVHGIVLSHGGEVELGSSPDGGMRVTVYLPAAAPDTAVPEVSPRRDRLDVDRAVIVVDDEPAVASVTSRMLEAAGHSVVTTGSATEALESIVGHGDGFDVLVTDYSMPGMNGVELAHHARSLHANLGVVLMSGYETDEALALVDCVVLKKPFSRAQLQAAVEAAAQHPETQPPHPEMQPELDRTQPRRPATTR